MAESDWEFDFQFEPGSLNGRSVVIAGGTGGLGAALTFLLAAEGARIVAGYRDNSERAENLRSELKERFSADITIVKADIQEPEGRTSLLDAAGEEGPYGLVCYTGSPARVAFEEASEEDLVESFKANYSSPVLLAREAAERMKDQGVAGAVVLISSMQAVAPFDSSINYAGPKAALNHATRILAKEWGGPNGIRVNSIAPGVNEAGMALESIASGKYDYFVNSGIIPRFGRSEDTARVARLLLEPDNYITGQVITVDGGLTLRRDRRRK